MPIVFGAHAPKTFSQFSVRFGPQQTNMAANGTKDSGPESKKRPDMLYVALYVHRRGRGVQHGVSQLGIAWGTEISKKAFQTRQWSFDSPDPKWEDGFKVAKWPDEECQSYLAKILSDAKSKTDQDQWQKVLQFLGLLYEEHQGQMTFVMLQPHETLGVIDHALWTVLQRPRGILYMSKGKDKDAIEEDPVSVAGVQDQMYGLNLMQITNVIPSLWKNYSKAHRIDRSKNDKLIWAKDFATCMLFQWITTTTLNAMRHSNDQVAGRYLKQVNDDVSHNQAPLVGQNVCALPIAPAQPTPATPPVQPVADSKAATV